MFTRFQHDVLAYFHEYAPVFIEYLATDTQQSLVDDLFPKLVQFLDRTIKLEIGLFAYGSCEYHKLLDMLIEVHIMKQDHFYDAICKEMNEAFRVGIA